MDYLLRAIDSQLDSLLPLAPAVAIDGPKGVGKSASAVRRAEYAWYLDQPEHRAIIEADLSLSGVPEGTILLDEWQRVPAVWDSVRRAVDLDAPPGRFLLTGSATPRAGVDTHSGAGRILSVRMRPMALFERQGGHATVSMRELLDGQGGDGSVSPPIAGTTTWTLTDYCEAIISSGFPGIAGAPEALRRDLLDSYIRRIIDRDLPEQGVAVRKPETLLRWLRAYAAASSTSATYSTILDATTAGDGTQPAKTTTIAYRDLLVQLWILDPLPGWSHSRNPLSRLQTAPKHQLADPALAARLMNLSVRGIVTGRGTTMAGPLFESLATLSVRVAAGAVGASVGHLRTRNGDREVDLIVEGADGQVLGIEVKLSSSVDDTDVRHLLWLRDQMPDDVVDLVILTTGTTAYRRQDGVAVVPLALLGL